MVRKLMKHELLALFRILAWWIGAVLLLSVLVRLSYELIFIPLSDGAYFNGTFVFLLFFLWIGTLFALAFAAVLVSATRFFRSLFTGEGYMTFSLPVTPTQLLVSKLLSAFIAFMACMMAIVLGIFIAIPVRGLTRDIEIIPTLFEDLFSSYLYDPLSMTEKILFVVVSIPAGILYCDLISSIAQLFTKRRILAFILILFGVSFVLSYLYALLIEPLIMLSNMSAHLIAWIQIGVYLLFDVAAFFVIRFILTHKVNLVV